MGGWKLTQRASRLVPRENPGDKRNARERFVFMAPLLNSSKYSNERQFDVRRKEGEREREKKEQRRATF